MYIYGNNPSPNYFQGSEASINVTIYPGWFDVYEYGNYQYMESASGDCHTYINPGETKTCTITNDDI
jgi:hypothetical protein